MNSKKEYIVSALICFVVISLFRIPGIGMQYMYGLHALNILDPDYLANTPEMIGINTSISPRLIFDYILLIPMKLGLSFELVNYMYNIIADFMFASAMVALVSALKVKRLLLSSLCLVLCVYAMPIISIPFGFPYHYPNVLSITMAVSVELIAVSFAIKERYGLAFLFACIGGLFHIHECMYGGAFVLILAAINCYKNRTISVKYILYSLGWLFFVVALAIPTLLTDHAEISNDVFCSYYMSEIGHFGFKKGLFSNVSYFLTIVALYYVTNKKLKGHVLVENDVAIILFSVAVFAMLFIILFVDIKPISFVYTLYVQKFFKYIALIFILQFVLYFDYLVDKNDYRPLLLALCWIPSIVITPVLIVFSAFFIFIFRAKADKIYLPLAAINLALYFGYSLAFGADYMKILVTLALLPLIFPYFNKKVILKYISIVSLFVFLFVGFGRYYNKLFSKLDPATEQDEGFYAEMSKEIDKSEMYILSPMEKDIYTAVGISSKSQRSCYVWPMVPSTLLGTQINIDRMNYLKGWENWTLEEKCRVSKKLGVNYLVLTQAEVGNERTNIVCDNRRYVLIKTELLDNRVRE